MFIQFEKNLENALIIVENLESRIRQLVGQVQKLEKKKNPALRRYKAMNNIQEPEDVIRSLAQWDPSGTENQPKGTYVSWILKLVATGQIRLPEDGSRLRNALTLFDKVKGTKRFSGEKDIHKYDSFRELEAITKKLQNELTQADEPTTLRSWFKWVEKQGVGLFDKDEKFTTLKFDSSAFQSNIGSSSWGSDAGITQGVKVVPKKAVVGQHGQEIEASWVPLWADPENTSTPSVVTPTAVALSRLACGTSYCVANPNTAQNYLNSGPLYAIFKDGEFYLLANHSWTEFMNQDDYAFDFMTAASAYYFSKLVVEKGDQLGESAVKSIVRIVKKSFEMGKIRGKSQTGEYDVSALPPAVGKTIKAAIEKGASL